MSRPGTSPRIFTARHRTTELIAGLLAGIGLGIGIGALAIGNGGTAQRVAPAARTGPARASEQPLGPATAGVQPGRGEPRASAEAAGETQAGAVAGAGHTAPVLDASAAASFARLQAGLPGRVELTVDPLGAGPAQTLGGDLAAHGWSTTKAPVLAALLRARGEALSSRERSLAASAITESDNESILELFHDLEQIEGGLTGASSYVQELLRRSGDGATIVATAPPAAGAVTTFGQTEWKPSNAVKFFSALARGCLLANAGTGYVLDLMQRIEPSESWGLGSAGFASVAFKGGWGPEPDGAYLVRQAGIVEVRSARAVAVAIVAFPPAGAGSFATGSAMLTETARWLHGHLNLVPRASLPCS
jgi:hypothetical protein